MISTWLVAVCRLHSKEMPVVRKVVVHHRHRLQALCGYCEFLHLFMRNLRDLLLPSCVSWHCNYPPHAGRPKRYPVARPAPRAGAPRGRRSGSECGPALRAPSPSERPERPGTRWPWSPHCNEDRQTTVTTRARCREHKG